ncbi:MAG: hypothetical protein WCK51_15005 [Armatimonadota bacterium]
MDYSPIDCEFHDVLEHHAVLKNRVALTVKVGDGSHELIGVISDFTIESGVEFLILSDHRESIRLDDVISCQLAPKATP